MERPGEAASFVKAQSEYLESARVKLGNAEMIKGISGGYMSSGTAVPSAWCVGLTPMEQREWLVDCFRMRQYDYFHTANQPRGLYKSKLPRETLSELLIFCLLCQGGRVLPTNWCWEAFLEQAQPVVLTPFSTADATAKYGVEDVAQVFMGGRSLRFTAAVVYCSSVEGWKKD
ncbi:hypothetical protein KIPB_002700, partial [Kipferlia bialata]|eukprot:g2700.t1